MTTQETCILRSLRPFLLIGKILGIFGCRIHGERVERSGVLSRFYCLLWIAITYYFNQISIYDFIDSSYDGKLQAIRTSAFFMTIASDMYISIFRQERIVGVFEKIHKYDRRVSDLGFARQDSVTIYRAMIVFPGTILFGEHMASIFLDNFRVRPLLLPRLRYWYYPLMSYFVVMKFCMIVHMIYQRFKYINEHISKRVVDGNGLYNRRSVTIYEIRYLHCKLCEATEGLMQIYSPLILLWCGVMMQRVSVCMINYFHGRAGYVSALLILPWIISLCISCSMASNEANKIARTLVANRPLSGDAADTMDRMEMVLYLCNHEVQFTAIRMYSVNKSFLLAVINMIVTYMTLARPHNSGPRTNK